MGEKSHIEIKGIRNHGQMGDTKSLNNTLCKNQAY